MTLLRNNSIDVRFSKFIIDEDQGEITVRCRFVSLHIIPLK